MLSSHNLPERPRPFNCACSSSLHLEPYTQGLVELLRIFHLLSIPQLTPSTPDLRSAPLVRNPQTTVLDIDAPDSSPSFCDVDRDIASSLSASTASSASSPHSAEEGAFWLCISTKFSSSSNSSVMLPRSPLIPSVPSGLGITLGERTPPDLALKPLRTVAHPVTNTGSHALYRQWTSERAWIGARRALR
ncbi:hypothetical protein HETIRDRAFT_450713 [Heterobasidion irregulare TC 32-1]|uniref:Uncharacterized protein n=1 Tax=Heterobasidion irregulare (strain TC 32-1) TaxID=747525 RepID=W4KB01_HETIT|nr:uncharacterized protein HETIRDRAFT_450713 [Heterobasidion irregulare TC 32-1]ETW83012.1 hypothetical protein HETIRDRAFT_450713 [Heterobasidion irregulare TC 32-1]